MLSLTYLLMTLSPTNFNSLFFDPTFLFLWEGVTVPGLHRQLVNNEMELRQYFETTTDNRSSFSLAPGASIDTSTGIWELELRQREYQMPGKVTRFIKSRLVVVDLAAIDPLVTLHAGHNNVGGGANNLWGGYRAPVVDTTLPQQIPHWNLSHVSPLVQSIAAFEEVVKRLSIPSQCPLAPFKASKLTHYLSELLGGNAVVAAIGFLSQGEAAISRKTLEVMESLTRTIHYPIGGREISDATLGLIRKYRAMTANATTELEAKQGDMIDKAAFDALKQGYEEKITEIEGNFQEMDKELQTTLQSLQTTVTELETLRQKDKEQEETIVHLTEQLATTQKESSHQVEEHEQERSEWTEKQVNTTASPTHPLSPDSARRVNSLYTYTSNNHFLFYTCGHSFPRLPMTLLQQKTMCYYKRKKNWWLKFNNWKMQELNWKKRTKLWEKLLQNLKLPLMHGMHMMKNK